MALAAGVRLWGIDYGLPCTYCRPDEDRLIATALRLSLHDLNPHYFIWPGSFFYITRGILEITTGVYAFFTSGFTGSSRDLYLSCPTCFHLVLRFIFCGFGLATVYLLFKLGKNLFSPTVGLLSAFFLALTFLHVRDSHFAMLDIPVAMLGVLFFLKAWKITRRGKWSDYLVAGCILGLSVATKYYAVVLTITLITAHISRGKLSLNHLSGERINLRLFLSLLLASAVFLILSPFTLLDFSAFLQEIRTGIISPQLVDGFHLLPRLNTARGWIYHVTFSFRYGLGWPLEIFSLAGIGFGLYRMLKGSIPERLIISFIIPFYLTLAFQKSCFVRYTTMLLPFFCLLGGELLERIFHRSKFRGLFLSFSALVLVLEPGLRVFQLDRLLSRPDTRLLAGNWMKDNIPLEAGVIFPQPMIFGRPDGFFSYYNRFVLPARSGRELLELSLSADRPTEKYTVVSEHILAYSSLDPGMKNLLEESTEEIYAVQGGDGDNSGIVYDPFDAFYLPLSGFDKVKLPGPRIRIFHLDTGHTGIPNRIEVSPVGKKPGNVVDPIQNLLPGLKSR